VFRDARFLISCPQALLLCFKLHESRTAVVSSTAAATLRQLVMFVVDKVAEEDKRMDTPSPSLTNVELPDGTSIPMRPSACDAYAVFEDLCLLANSEQPNYLKLNALPKTFALELIESVVTNHHEVFRTVRPLLFVNYHLLTYMVSAPRTFTTLETSPQSTSSQDCIGSVNLPAHVTLDAGDFPLAQTVL
jgi:hypothetical protein